MEELTAQWEEGGWGGGRGGDMCHSVLSQDSGPLTDSHGGNVQVTGFVIMFEYGEELTVIWTAWHHGTAPLPQNPGAV